MADENNEGLGDASKQPAEGSGPPEGATPDASSSVEAAQEATPSTAVAMTPGQRLAAKKAQKATQKREFKEELKRSEEEARVKEQQEADRLLGRGPAEPALPQNVERAASKFTTFLQTYRAHLAVGVVGALGVLGIGYALTHTMSTGNREQAAALGRALELASATIDADDADGQTDDGKPSFKTEAERQKAATEALAAAVKIDPDSVAGRWATVAQGAIELRRAKFEEAQGLFQRAASADDKNAFVRARALEGVAVALEAQSKPEDAKRQFEALKSSEGEQALADYHMARLRLEQGDREGGKALLKALYDQLRASPEDAPESPYLRSEVELRLAEIDSSLVEQGSTLQQPGQFSDEQLQRLIEQLQRGQAPEVPSE